MKIIKIEIKIAPAIINAFDAFSMFNLLYIKNFWKFILNILYCYV